MFERGDGEASGDTLASAAGLAKGAYVLAEAPSGTPDVILIATGSEVQLAVAAPRAARRRGHPRPRRLGAEPRVVRAAGRRVPRVRCCPAAVTARVSVEAGIALTWRRYVGDRGRSVSIEHFGASADYKTLFREFGITADAVVAAAKESLASA